MRRDQRGIAVSSPLALLSVAAVVVAGAAFVLTNDEEQDAPVRAAATTTASATPTPAVAAPDRKPVRKKRAPVRRGDTFVEVFNNTGISGLAGSTAARAQGAGWRVVGSDNWYGTIPATTVYFPPGQERQAGLLGKDLGIARIKPAIPPMGGDRLTVILTSDYV